MRSTLSAVLDTPGLHLHLVLTGMHLDRSRGRSIDAVRREGWRIDRVVPWPAGNHSASDHAVHTGRAMAALAATFNKLNSDVVLVVGDRVEAFAAAAAAPLCGIAVAHVHGGDRALGQVDDSLRHAITKLAHLHFPATRQSAGAFAGWAKTLARSTRSARPASTAFAMRHRRGRRSLRDSPAWHVIATRCCCCTPHRPTLPPKLVQRKPS